MQVAWTSYHPTAVQSLATKSPMPSFLQTPIFGPLPLRSSTTTVHYDCKCYDRTKLPPPAPRRNEARNLHLSFSLACCLVSCGTQRSNSHYNHCYYLAMGRQSPTFLLSAINVLACHMQKSLLLEAWWSLSWVPYRLTLEHWSLCFSNCTESAWTTDGISVSEILNWYRFEIDTVNFYRVSLASYSLHHFLWYLASFQKVSFRRHFLWLAFEIKR